MLRYVFNDLGKNKTVHNCHTLITNSGVFVSTELEAWSHSQQPLLLLLLLLLLYDLDI